jgi:hypothetical protein
MSEEEAQTGYEIIEDVRRADVELLKELQKQNPALTEGELMDEIMRRNHPGMIAFIEAARDELSSRRREPGGTKP